MSRAAGYAGGPSDYDRAAAPVLAIADHLADLRKAGDLPQIQSRIRAALDRFSADLGNSPVPRPSIAPARLALGLVLDHAARGNRAIPTKEWGAAAHRLLFEGEEMSVSRLRDFLRRAEAAGEDYAATAAFLRGCLERIEDARNRVDLPVSDGWGAMAATLVMGFLVLVVAWAGYKEWVFHTDTTRAFDAEVINFGLDRSGEIADLAPRLDRLADAVDRVEGSLDKLPVRLFSAPFGFDALAHARSRQAEAAARHLPGELARAVDTALSREGDAGAAYDTLRAWDILNGAAEWNPAWLAGWLGARAVILPDQRGLAPHVALLVPPLGPLPPPDPELLAQAREFAAEAAEDERAWLELIRSAAMAEVAPWRPATEIPALADVAVRRSGLPIGTPIPGATTARGWDHTRQEGAGLAVQRARAEARRMFGRDLPTMNDSPDRVLARLQDETLATWKSFLADLRVRPFTGRDTAIIVSGLLAQRDSLLTTLIGEVWREVGGTDRQRPHNLQLRIATEFGPTIQYVEQDRMREISALFAALNAALGASGATEELELQKLMSLQDRAASITALRQAPGVVVQLVEDVLAHTAGSHSDELSNPLTKRWQTDVLDLCRRTTQGRYPFATEGPDADLADFAALFGPGGALNRYFRTAAEQYLDTTAAPWRWKPDARFAGLSPESAAYLQHALAIGHGYFAADGSPGTMLTLAALAERGRATVSLGGLSAAVDAVSDEATFPWPGSDPGGGAEVVFQTGNGSTARISHPGPWGLLRLFDGVRLRERDGGRRYFADLRTEGARLFLEVSFPDEANPVSLRRLLAGFECPATL
jgi:type VI protein secretion system component VasK